MPAPRKVVALLLLPPAHLTSALHTILVEGHGLGQTGWDLPIVAAWAGIATLFAARRLSWG